jgi:hypothetical protein
VKGSVEEIARAFREAFLTLDRRMSSLLSLPIAIVGALAPKREVERIGTS